MGDTVKVIDKSSFVGKFLDNFHDEGDTKFSLKVDASDARRAKELENSGFTPQCMMQKKCSAAKSAHGKNMYVY